VERATTLTFLLEMTCGECGAAPVRFEVGLPDDRRFEWRENPRAEVT
jgi:hypothetical protein